MSLIKSLLKELNLSTKMSAFQKAVDSGRDSQAQRFVKNIIDEIKGIEFELASNNVKIRITNLYIFPMSLKEDFERNYEKSTGKSLSNQQGGEVLDDYKDLPAFMRKGENRSNVWDNEDASLLSQKSELEQNYLILEFSSSTSPYKLYLLYSPVMDKFTEMENDSIDLVSKYGFNIKYSNMTHNKNIVSRIFQIFERKTYPKNNIPLFTLKSARDFSKVFKKLVPNTTLTFNYFVNQQTR